MRRLAIALFAIVALPAVAPARQWKAIGKTKKDGSELFVQPKSIKLYLCPTIKQ